MINVQNGKPQIPHSAWNHLCVFYMCFHPNSLYQNRSPLDVYGLQAYHSTMSKTRSGWLRPSITFQGLMENISSIKSIRRCGYRTGWVLNVTYPFCYNCPLTVGTDLHNVPHSRRRSFITWIRCNATSQSDHYNVRSFQRRCNEGELEHSVPGHWHNRDWFGKGAAIRRLVSNSPYTL